MVGSPKLKNLNQPKKWKTTVSSYRTVDVSLVTWSLDAPSSRKNTKCQILKGLVNFLCMLVCNQSAILDRHHLDQLLCVCWSRLHAGSGGPGRAVLLAHCGGLQGDCTAAVGGHAVLAERWQDAAQRHQGVAESRCTGCLRTIPLWQGGRHVEIILKAKVISVNILVFEKIWL